MSFNYVVWMEDETAVELYIDTGDRDENKQVFDGMFGEREAIEQVFAGPLEWQRLDDKRACRIRHLIQQGGLTSGDDRWPAIQETMIDEMSRLVKALRPHLGVAN